MTQVVDVISDRSACKVHLGAPNINMHKDRGVMHFSFQTTLEVMCTDSFNANKITGSVETQHAQRP